MNTDEAYDYFSAHGVSNARQFFADYREQVAEGHHSARQAFADYYRKMVEEGLRSAREEPLIEHDEVMRMLKETIERHASK